MKPSARWFAALLVGAVAVWLVTPTLRWPARVFVIFLAVPLPALAVLQVRALAHVDLATLPRVSVYVSSGITLWCLAFAALLAAQYSHFTPVLLGLRSVAPDVFGAWVVVVLGSALALLAFGKAFGQTESPLLNHLLPRTAAEKLAFIALAITAGICEEIVFRGFLIAALASAAGSIVIAAVFSSCLFGLLHAYQNPAGAARAAALGFALALPYVVSGSIYPAIVAHAAIDLIGGLWLVRRFG